MPSCELHTDDAKGTYNCLWRLLVCCAALTTAPPGVSALGTAQLRCSRPWHRRPAALRHRTRHITWPKSAGMTAAKLDLQHDAVTSRCEAGAECNQIDRKGRTLDLPEDGSASASAIPPPSSCEGDCGSGAGSSAESAGSTAGASASAASVGSSVSSWLNGGLLSALQHGHALLATS